MSRLHGQESDETRCAVGMLPSEAPLSFLHPSDDSTTDGRCSNEGMPSSPVTSPVALGLKEARDGEKKIVTQPTGLCAGTGVGEMGDFLKIMLCMSTIS